MVYGGWPWPEKYIDRATNRARPRKSLSTSATSTLAISIYWCTRVSIPIAPTSSGRRFATSSPRTDAVKQSIVRHTLELGLRRYSREDLEAVREAGGKLRIQVVGLAAIAEDVTPELALATIESITVLGALQASKAVKAALSDRIG
jgi:Ribbon-Helix-Helix transcriptional regulator family